MDLPLESIHKHALKAAEAAACAGEQGQFWGMHDRLFANQKALAPEQLRTYAEALQLDLSQFNSCLESGRHAKSIRKDMATARAAGLTSTPSFGIGFTDPKDPNKVRVVQTIRGAQAFSAFKTALDGLLSKVKKPPKPPAAPQQ
jgi:protein-disulfide isomerase